MLKNMKVGKSLILGFAITIVIAVAFILMCIVMMLNQDSKYQSLLEREVVANEEILYARNNANIAARNVRDILLIPDDAINDDLEARAREVLVEMDGNLKALDAAWPEGHTKDNLNKYVTAVNEWTAVVDDILAVYNQYKTTGNQSYVTQAIQMVSASCTPALNDMAALAKEVDADLVKSQETAIAEIEGSVRMTIIVLVICMVVATVLVVAMVLVLIRSITGPTEQVRHALVGFSQGQFDIPVEFESKNELGEMCQALRDSQDCLKTVVGEVGYLMGEMAKGNFALQFKDESVYVGGLVPMREAIRGINHNLSDTLAQINLSAEQVSAGSEQVSTGAQALAQGATEQASAVQELSATIQEISSAAQRNAANSSEARSRSLTAGGQVEESTKYMEEMVQAMDKISKSSEEIAKIIATIENIAFQTNILALNAAVEAARAGSAGKGFAVVADEVRNLSAKSDQAAKATKDLIDNSVASVQEGTAIVRKVSDSLSKTMELAGSAMESMKMVAKAVEEETEAISQVTEGIDQISSVVQTNSATSEQSAAASEELSSQANIMKSLMSKFKLRESDDGGALPIAHSSSYGSVDDEMVSAVSSFSKY